MWQSCIVALSSIAAMYSRVAVSASGGGLGCAAAVYSAQGCHDFVVLVFSLHFYATYFVVVLFGEELDDRRPPLVDCVVVIVNELGLEEPALVHLADEEDCFCCVRY